MVLLQREQDLRLKASFSSSLDRDTETYIRRSREANIDTEEINTKLTRQGRNHLAGLTSNVFSTSQVIHNPSYDLYYHPDGRVTNFLRHKEQEFRNLQEDSRDADLAKKCLKFEVDYSETIEERRRAVPRYHQVHMTAEYIRLLKWDAEAELKEHKATARFLKAKHCNKVKKAERRRQLDAFRKKRPWVNVTGWTPAELL